MNKPTVSLVTKFHRTSEPRDLSDLSVRAETLAGRTLGELAGEQAMAIPPDLRRAKGWVGNLIERCLGASAGNRAEPDFPKLGVELKTLPIDARGKPLESTFVCTIALSKMADTEWELSRLREKLAHVLWVPVEATRELPLGIRRVARPFFWQPSAAQESELRADWEAFSLAIAQGRTEEISGHFGQHLQIRPKAARGDSTRRAMDENGALYDQQPKGFYLRPSFTQSLVRAALSPA